MAYGPGTGPYGVAQRGVDAARNPLTSARLAPEKEYARFVQPGAGPRAGARLAYNLPFMRPPHFANDTPSPISPLLNLSAQIPSPARPAHATCPLL